MLRIPSATYRLQFNSAFTFRDATRIIPYLDDLGITDVYGSPIFQATPGSTHGYDVTNYTAINPALGTEDDFHAFSAALKKRGMGFLVDIVPNHMGIADVSNVWWQDVLENGPSSPYASFFDIDWYPPTSELREKVLLPILGDQFGAVLERGEIRIAYEHGAFHVVYYDRRFPAAPKSTSLILERCSERLHAQLGSADPRLLELQSIITALRNLPSRSEGSPEKIRERLREKEIIKSRTRALTENNPDVAEALNAVIEEFCGVKGIPHSFDPLEEFLKRQAYMLCYWRVAADEINYRRFFDINELAAIRVEHPETFAAVHALALRLVREGTVTGLRIDHPDGLFDPEKYFSDLQAACGEEGSRRKKNIYMVIEKILGHNEVLPPQWAVHGTVGYDFMNKVNGLFVRQDARRDFRNIYNSFVGPADPFPDLVYESKKMILRVAMTSELHVLATLLDSISWQHRSSRDFTLWSLQEALGEIVACFPVYRSYVRAETGEVSEWDRRHIHNAVSAAKRRNPATDESVFRFIESVLLLDEPEGLSPEQITRRREFVMRFQQLTGPVMAKGVEDTAFYRYFPLASLNEVGGHPDSFGTSVEEFHRHNAYIEKKRPHTLLATSTHDTKRGEDVRARMNVLSEIPDQWNEAIRRWSAMNEKYKREIDGAPAPDAGEEYLLYQTLLGAWPIELDRIKRYIEKALKEAKLRTSWINPRTEYDEAVGAFIEAVLGNSDFLRDLELFVGKVRMPGFYNSLSQTLLKMTSPGIPDFYQGTEIWNWSLVDPDNRRPVDFERRAKLEESFDVESGAAKLTLIRKVLKFRREHRALFEEGDYIPLMTEGPSAEHIVAFMRRHDNERLIVAAGRFFAAPVTWNGSVLYWKGRMKGNFRNLFTGRVVALRRHERGVEIPAADVFDSLPVAVLFAE